MFGQLAGRPTSDGVEYLHWQIKEYHQKYALCWYEVLLSTSGSSSTYVQCIALLTCWLVIVIGYLSYGATLLIATHWALYGNHLVDSSAMGHSSWRVHLHRGKKDLRHQFHISSMYSQSVWIHNWYYPVSTFMILILQNNATRSCVWSFFGDFILYVMVGETKKIYHKLSTLVPEKTV